MPICADITAYQAEIQLHILRQMTAKGYKPIAQMLASIHRLIYLSCLTFAYGQAESKQMATFYLSSDIQHSFYLPSIECARTCLRTGPQCAGYDVVDGNKCKLLEAPVVSGVDADVHGRRVEDLLQPSAPGPDVTQDIVSIF